MTTPSLQNEEIHALNQARQRLSQLSAAITSLQASLAQSDPLPPWASLQSSIKIVSQHVESLSKTLILNNDLFSRLAVFPLPEYPAITQESLLGALLRKKTEPAVEDWQEEGLTVGVRVPNENNGTSISLAELEELWDWAPVAIAQELRQYRQIFGGNYTLEERAMGIENVVTGLKRKLDDDDEEEEEEDEEEDDEDVMKDDSKPVVAKVEEAAVPALTIHDQMRFMMTGVEPVIPLPA